MSLTAIAFLAAYVAGLGLALLRHPRYGLYTYLAVFYLDPPARWWAQGLPDLRWSLLAAVVTLLVTMRLPQEKSTPSWTSTTPARLLLVFLVWVWVQNLWAILGPEHFEFSIMFSKYAVLYYLLYRLIDSPQRASDFLFAHVLGCGYLGWLAYVAPEGGRLEGVGGPGIDEANALGMFLATGAICGALLIVGQQSWKRWLSLALMPFIVNAIVQTESRGSVLALVAAGALSLYVCPRAYRARLYVAGIVGVLAFAAVAPLVFWERMVTVQAAVGDTAELDTSSESRIELAKAQLRMFGEQPWGTGHRGTAALSSRFLDQRYLTWKAGDDPATGARSSHNTLLSMLVEHGIPGIVIAFIGLGWGLRTLRRLRRLSTSAGEASRHVALYGACATCSLAVVLVAGLFTDYLNSEVQIWMCAVLGALLVRYVGEPVGAQAARAAETARRATVAVTTRSEA